MRKLHLAVPLLLPALPLPSTNSFPSLERGGKLDEICLSDPPRTTAGG